MNEINPKIKPFLKWAGGKTQILPYIDKSIPPILKTVGIDTYIEPFIGGGSVFFNIASNYKVNKFVLNDGNKDLFLMYKVIKDKAPALIESLKKLKKEFTWLSDKKRSDYYYTIRSRYNNTGDDSRDEILQKAVYGIFLNKTCFNGLYRKNKKGEFNVPYGRYKNPEIFNESNLLNISRILKKVKLCCGDFTLIEKHITGKTFIYFDPPYRPISKTSSFTSYDINDFDDNEQRRLADFYINLDKNYKNISLMMSNSDPRNINKHDDFFDSLYRGYHIHRIYANRMINSNSIGRGKITELLILNYSIKNRL
jgi:DNA adenine methylase